MVLGIHWGPWTASPADKWGLLYCIRTLPFSSNSPLPIPFTDFPPVFVVCSYVCAKPDFTLQCQDSWAPKGLPASFPPYMSENTYCVTGTVLGPTCMKITSSNSSNEEGDHHHLWNAL